MIAHMRNELDSTARRPENQKNNLFKKILPPVTLIGIGATSIILGRNDLNNSWGDLKMEADSRYPHMASSAEVEQAKMQVLVFDKAVQDLVIAGKIEEIPTAINKLELAESIMIVRQEEKRKELYSQRFNPLHFRNLVDIAGMVTGISLLIVGLAWMHTRLDRLSHSESKNQSSLIEHK